MGRLDLLLAKEDQDFLADFAKDVSNACRYSAMEDTLKAKAPNHLPFDPVKPGDSSHTPPSGHRTSP